MINPAYNEVIGKHKGWSIQSHPRMRRFDQYHHEERNTYLSVFAGGRWELFKPDEDGAFGDEPTHWGDTIETLKEHL